MILLLLVSLACADPTSIPLTSLSAPNAQEAVQQALDDKFGVTGGTFAGQVNIDTLTVTARFTSSSGITFTNTTGSALTFNDGTTQNTAAASLTAAQTFSGTNTFTSNLQIAGGGGFVYGQSSDPNTLNLMQDAVWAQSTDGASQSSGCVVAVGFPSGAANAQLQFTSTTTAINLATQGVVAGVLLETCATNATCRVGLRGVYRITVGTAVNAQLLAFSTTRCQVGPDNALDASAIGYPLVSGNQAAGTIIWAAITQ